MKKWLVVAVLGIGAAAALYGLVIVADDGTAPPAAPDGEMVYFRVATAAGLMPGAPVLAGEDACGTVTSLDLVTGGVIVSCCLTRWPDLHYPVAAVIQRAAETGNRFVVLRGNDLGTEKLQPGDMLEGSVAVPAPAGALAPMRIE